MPTRRRIAASELGKLLSSQGSHEHVEWDSYGWGPFVHLELHGWFYPRTDNMR